MNPTSKIIGGYIIVALGFLLIIVGVNSFNMVLILFAVLFAFAGGVVVTIGLNERNKTTIPFYTTDSVPGKQIIKSFGSVESGSNPLAGSGVAQSSAKKALEKEALKLGANAIVGLKTERNQSAKNINYYMYGTAVILEEE